MASSGISTGPSTSPSSTSGYSTSDNFSSRSPSTTGSSTGTSSTSTTSTELSLPPVINPLTPRPPRRKGQEHITSEAAEKTALIIGIIAGAMIAIILIILIILKFKGRSDGSYKIDETKTFQQTQGPNTALLGAGCRQQCPQQINGNLKNSGDKYGNRANKKCDTKDVKEWYV